MELIKNLIFAGALVVLSLTGCKTTGDTGHEDPSDADTDADTDTGPDCYVAWAEGTCYDTTVCEQPTEAGSDSLSFLNQCSSVDYALFDNAARIPASTWTEGEPLPAI